MLYYILLYYIILFYFILYYITLYYIIVYYIIIYYIMLHYLKLYYIYMTNKGWECRDVIETREVNLQDLRISPKLKWPSNISLQISRHPLTYPIDLLGLPGRSQPTSRTRAYAKCQIGSIFGIPYYDPTCPMVLEYVATFTTKMTMSSYLLMGSWWPFCGAQFVGAIFGHMSRLSRQRFGIRGRHICFRKSHVVITAFQKRLEA